MQRWVSTCSGCWRPGLNPDPAELRVHTGDGYSIPPAHTERFLPLHPGPGSCPQQEAVGAGPHSGGGQTPRQCLGPSRCCVQHNGALETRNSGRTGLKPQLPC